MVDLKTWVGYIGIIAFVVVCPAFVKMYSGNVFWSQR